MVLEGELKKNKHAGTLDNSHCMVEQRFLWASHVVQTPLTLIHTASPAHYA